MVKFGQIYVATPVCFEADGDIRELYPHEARLRSLTYMAPVYIDVTSNQYELDEKRQ